MSSLPLRYWSPTTFSAMSTETIDIVHSRPSEGIIIFGTCMNPPSHSLTAFSKAAVEHDHAATFNNNVPLFTNAYSRGEEATVGQKYSTFPIEANSELNSQTKCTKEKQRKNDELRSSSSNIGKQRKRKSKSNNTEWPEWLPLDWQIISRIRKGGTLVGQVWKTYVSPEGRRFKSKPEVLRRLSQY